MGSGISQLVDITNQCFLLSNTSCKYKISSMYNLLKQLNIDGGAGCKLVPWMVVNRLLGRLY